MRVLPKTQGDSAAPGVLAVCRPAQRELVSHNLAPAVLASELTERPARGVTLALRMASRPRCVATHISGETRIDGRKLSYTWTVRNFSFRREETGEKIESLSFTSPVRGDPDWRLHLYPNGEDVGSKGYVSLYLVRLSEGCYNCFFEYKLALLDEAKREVRVQQTTAPILPGGRWGFAKFIERDCLLKGADSLLLDDTLTIYCEVFSFADSAFYAPSKAAVTVPDCHLSQDLGRLLESRQYCDVILSVEGQEIHAHKNILAARSPVFAAMFEHEMKENKHGRVEMTDCDFEVLHEVVEFIYTGRAPKLNEMAEEVLVAANKYDLRRLKVMCEDILCSKLSVGTAAEMLALADMHNADQLKANALRLIKASGALVVKTDGWKAMASAKPHLVAEAFCALVI